MNTLRKYGWIIPGIVPLILVLTTPISPWVLGGAAALVTALGYLVDWWIKRPRETETHHSDPQ